MLNDSCFLQPKQRKSVDTLANNDAGRRAFVFGIWSVKGKDQRFDHDSDGGCLALLYRCRINQTARRRGSPGLLRCESWFVRIGCPLQRPEDVDPLLEFFWHIGFCAVAARRFRWCHFGIVED